MNASVRAAIAELLSPLMLAAYAAWATVWLTTVGRLDGRAAVLVAGALLVFLAAFVGRVLADRDARRGGRRLTLATLAASALLVIAQMPSGTSPILLVLLAGMLAQQWRGAPLALALLAINAALVAIMHWRWDTRPGDIAVLLAAYGSFQLFAAMVMRAAERAEAMAQDVRSVNAELIATRSLLEQSTRDAERLRLSRELHDVAGHALTALKLNLAALARDPRQPDPERVQLCAGLADDLLQNLRGVVRQMRGEHGIDVRGAIERLAVPFPRPAVHVEVDPDITIERMDRAEAILRTVQEGLTNAARHSAARNLWVVLQRDGDRLRLELHDDGRGSTLLAPGSGLSGMRERLQAAGGGLDIDAGAGRGLRLHAWLPAGATP